ncbi:hypothetical protein ACHAXS_004758 [Conticribra weissflogii]
MGNTSEERFVKGRWAHGENELTVSRDDSVEVLIGVGLGDMDGIVEFAMDFSVWTDSFWTDCSVLKEGSVTTSSSLLLEKASDWFVPSTDLSAASFSFVLAAWIVGSLDATLFCD